MIDYTVKAVGGPAVYHVINWFRFGTWCHLPLNQDYRFFEDPPSDCVLCDVCAFRQGLFPLEAEVLQEPDVGDVFSDE